MLSAGPGDHRGPAPGTGSFLKVKWTKADGTEAEAVVLRSDLGM
jgi:hypothetical protein